MGHVACKWTLSPAEIQSGNRCVLTAKGVIFYRTLLGGVPTREDDGLVNLLKNGQNATFSMYHSHLGVLRSFLRHLPLLTYNQRPLFSHSLLYWHSMAVLKFKGITVLLEHALSSILFVFIQITKIRKEDGFNAIRSQNILQSPKYLHFHYQINPDNLVLADFDCHFTLTPKLYEKRILDTVLAKWSDVGTFFEVSRKGKDLLGWGRPNSISLGGNKQSAPVTWVFSLVRGRIDVKVETVKTNGQLSSFGNYSI